MNMKHPPFCPNPDCKHHQLQEKKNGWFYHDGDFPLNDGKRIKRFRCKSCKKRFSENTFSLSYFLKKKGSFDYVFKQLKSTAGIRDISRDLKISPASVLLRIGRLARQSVSIHLTLRDRIELQEHLIADGFESFVVSQYFPNNINLLAGKNSQYLYSFDYSHLSRKGRMTSSQKRKNKRLKERFKLGTSVATSFGRICHSVSHLLWRSRIGPLILYTDKKNEYRDVIKDFFFPKEIQHIRISSKLARTTSNDLFSVNYLDREIRKALAEHVRETMRFGRNVNNMMERLAVYSLYHNYIKAYRINRKDDDYRDRTHAEAAGIDKKEIQKELKTLFTQRRFLTRTPGIETQDLLLWKRCHVTPLNDTYQNVPAFAA
jgi:transposase-like protein